MLFGYLGGELKHGSIEQFYRNVDTVPGGGNFKARVDVLLLDEFALQDHHYLLL